MNSTRQLIQKIGERRSAYGAFPEPYGELEDAFLVSLLQSEAELDELKSANRELGKKSDFLSHELTHFLTDSLVILHPYEDATLYGFSNRSAHYIPYEVSVERSHRIVKKISLDPSIFWLPDALLLSVINSLKAIIRNYHKSLCLDNINCACKNPWDPVLDKLYNGANIDMEKLKSQLFG